MTFDILTLFPGMFASPFEESILGKAVARELISVRAHNLRDWAQGRHQVTDDAPYGGGDGMIMKVEPAARALRDLRDRVVAVAVDGSGSREVIGTNPGL